MIRYCPTLLIFAFTGFCLCFSSPAPAQEKSKAAYLEADPADVSSIDAIMTAVYDVISGDAGEKRDWDRFRSLFVEGARLIPLSKNQDDGFRTMVSTPEEYIQRANAYLVENGFFEREISRKTDRFGNIAQVFSTYDSRHKRDDPTPFARGINSFQLMNDGKRWWVVTIFWQGESDAFPIPRKYLKKKKK